MPEATSDNRVNYDEDDGDDDAALHFYYYRTPWTHRCERSFPNDRIAAGRR